MQQLCRPVIRFHGGKLVLRSALMIRLFAAVTLSLVGVPQSLPEGRAAQQPASPPPVSTTAAPSALPPIPKGRSTVIGGRIVDVDPVRDEFILKVFGGRSMKLVFDERTQVFRDGVRIPLLKLHPEDHASVETTLDGTRIFALRIHMLSRLPEGEYQGQVLSYNRQTEEITLKVASSQRSIKLRVPPGTPVMRVDQDPSSVQQRGLADLSPGALVRVTLLSGTGGQGVASEIDVLASPGSVAIFSGKLSFLDLHSGRLVIVDPRDNESHDIVYDASRFPVSSQLHEGMDVKVTTNFDGSRYVANAIALE